MNATDSPQVRKVKEQNPQYFLDKRATAIREVKKDREKTDDELLVDIHDESLASLEERPAHETIVRTVARFAALVSSTAVRNEKAAADNYRTAKIALWIAILAAVISIAQLAFAWLEYSQPSKHMEQPSASAERQVNARDAASVGGASSASKLEK